jgi:phospholipase C
MKRVLFAITVVTVAVIVGGTVKRPQATAAVQPIRHVIVIFQENQSFDDVLGAYCAAVANETIHRNGLNRGCNGVTRATTMSGQPPLTTMPDIVPEVDHSVGGQIRVIDKGAMDRWLTLTGCGQGQCLALHRPSQSPNLVTLANRFAISDATFESSTSPSWAGHLEIVAASKDRFFGNNPQYVAGPGVPPEGWGWGCDSNRSSRWGAQSVWMPSCVPDFSLPSSSYPFGGAFGPTSVSHIPTILDRLGATGLTWKLYGGNGPITSTVRKPNGYHWAICPSFAGCLDTAQARNFVPNARVITDATNGTLPSFAVVTPTQRQSQHNSASWTAGDNWIGQVVSSIENGPQWLSTTIFITWDDCGCFYDHVNPLQYDARWGIRVPTVIVSPYARAGFTDSSPTSYPGFLAYAEHLFGLTPLGSEDQSAYDFRNSFNYAQMPIKGVVMIRRSIPARSVRWLATHHVDEDDPT